MEESLVGLFGEAPILISLVAGILTFLSPCVLPLIPIYLSYVSNISINELKDSEALSFKSRLFVLRNSIFFIFGMGIVFVLLGAVSARILSGGILLSSYVSYVAGGILIIFGLCVMNVIKIPSIQRQKTFDFTKLQKFSFAKDILTPFLLGASFSFGWTPCVGPILAGIISLASFEGERGIWLMVVYTLGFSIPFLLCSMLIGYAFNALNKIKRYFRVIEFIVGSLLIIIGILVASGGMSKISLYLVEIYK